MDSQNNETNSNYTQTERYCTISKFIDACRGGYLEIVKDLVENHGLVSYADARRKCICGVALEWSCINGNLELVKYLVDTFKLTEDDVRANDNCAFKCSCSNGHLEVVKYLVNTFDFDSRRCKGRRWYGFSCQLWK